MTLRFQADADLNHIILYAVIRREPALAFQTAETARLTGLSDPEVLALAARDGRVLVTHDQKTMPRHFAAFITMATSPGVLIIPQRLPVATVVEDLLLIWSTMDAGRLGFVIDFPVWVRSCQPILEFIARMPAFQSRRLKPVDLARLCTTAHFSFLLNGWNEISEVYSEEAVRALADLERSFRTAGIIIATRTHHIKPPLPGSFRLKLLALKRAQRNDYLRQALGGQATKLISQLEGNRALDELTRTPLILSEVVKLFENGRPIPTTKLGVLDAVRQLIEESDEHRDHLQRPPLLGRTTDYLTSLAFEMTAQGHVDISEERARSIELVASFQEWRRYARWPWWTPSAADESDPARKTWRTPRQHVGRQARDCWMFYPHASAVCWPHKCTFSPHTSRD